MLFVGHLIIQNIIFVLIIVGIIIYLSIKRPKRIILLWLVLSLAILLATFLLISVIEKNRAINVSCGGLLLKVRNKSQGVLNDAKVLCQALYNPLNRHKTIHIEDTHFGQTSSKDMILVNGDITDFRKFKWVLNHPKTLLCKTRYTYSLLKNRFRSIYIGFTSIDRFMPNVSKDPLSCLHVCGTSPHKNTTALLKAWALHPEWPKLICVGRNVRFKNAVKAPNLDLVTEFLSNTELQTLMNRIPVHVCPSRFEGFGHYLNEARSVGAIVLYSNAQPMNEFFEDGRSGIALNGSVKIEKRRGISIECFYPSTSDFENGINRLLNMKNVERERMGIEARKAYLNDKSSFEKRFNSMVRPDI